MSFKHVRGRSTKILVLNPNSSKAMTDGMKTVIDSVDLPYSTEVYTYTGPANAPASINDGEDIRQSTDAVLADLQETEVEYDGILIACFSVHPLVTSLQTGTGYVSAVTGIFEASILTALPLLLEGEKWGIVTTGKFWEEHLDTGVRNFLGAGHGDNSKFAGVESTGLNASDFHHGVDPEVVKRKLKEATKRLIAEKNGKVTCIVMGCAGMAGLEDIIRSAVAEEKSEFFALFGLHVVDGVRAGIMQLENTIKHRNLRTGRRLLLASSEN